MPITPIPNCLISAFKHDREIYFTIAGAMRLSNSEEIKNAIMPFLDDQVDTAYLSLNQLSELDSAGLGVIVGMHMTARKRKLNLSIVSPTAFVAKLFETTKLTSVLTILHGIEAEQIRAQFEKPELALA